MESAANKRHSLNREESLQSESGRIAPPEVGSDSGRHQALRAERAAAAFSWFAPRGVARINAETRAAALARGTARFNLVGCRSSRAESQLTMACRSGLDPLRKIRHSGLQREPASYSIQGRTKIKGALLGASE